MNNRTTMLSSLALLVALPLTSLTAFASAPPTPDLLPLCRVVGTLTTLHTFAASGADGAHPEAGVTEANDGNFYGATTQGGIYSSGTLYKITPTGVESVVYTFGTQYPTDGMQPATTLIQASDGNLYGATDGWALNGINPTAGYPYGTVFKMSLGGAFTTVHDLDPKGAEGNGPSALVQGTDGNFYGTTSGAFNDNLIGFGTVFKMTPQGVLTTLHSFTGSGTDGDTPAAGLVLGGDGNFYGVTQLGGEFGVGTVYQITPAGTYQTIHSFDGSDGEIPSTPLIRGPNGSFYGTTNQGGADGAGTVFQITPHVVFEFVHDHFIVRIIYDLTTLHDFAGSPGTPVQPSSLIQGADGYLYGTIRNNSPNPFGAIFRLTPGGAFTTLYTFSGPDGAQPSGLIQGSDGKFYGTTDVGGENDTGTVFTMSLACVRNFLSP